MKVRTLSSILFLIGVLLAVAILSQGGARGPLFGSFSSGPRAFNSFAFPASGLIRFLASERGRQILRMSPHPVAKGLLKLFGEEVTRVGFPGPLLRPPNLPLGSNPLSVGATSGCGQLAGTRFNLEPRTGDPAAPREDGSLSAWPQNEESIDFLLNRAGGGSADLIVEAANDFRGFFGGLGGSATGFYVHRSGNDCTADFEGGLPSVVDVNGITLFGSGDPIVAADPARDAFFAGDLHFGVDPNFTEFDSSVGIFRTNAATLTNSSLCPPGSHEYNDTPCWPTGRVINPQNTFATGLFNDKPHVAVDERPNGRGTGAGDVYVTNTVIDNNNGTSTMELVACNNNLSACSSPMTVSGSAGTAFFTFTLLSHVSVRPDGGVTISYVFLDGTNGVTGACFSPPFPPCQTIDLEWVACTPAGAPQAPICSSPTLILREPQPLTFLAGQGPFIFTYPKHDHQVEPDGTIQTIVVWDRCKVPDIETFLCVDSDVVMVASNNNGASWSEVTGVNTEVHNQFFPWIKTDRSNNTVNIVYYSSQNDAFQHRVQVFLNQIHPGTAIPNPVEQSHMVTTELNDLAVDLTTGGSFFGDYIGVAARGATITGQRRAYIGYTYNTSQGIYNGIPVPEENNHLSRFDY